MMTTTTESKTTSGLNETDIAFLRKSMAHPCPVLQVEPTEAMLSLEKRGYIRFDGVRCGPLGVVTGEKWVAVTEAGRIALALAGVPDPERAVGELKAALVYARVQVAHPSLTGRDTALRLVDSALALLGATTP